MLDVSYKNSVQFLLANLTALTITLSRSQVVGYGNLLNASDVLSLHSFCTFQDFILPESEPEVLSLFTAQDFPQLYPVQLKEVLNLLD